MSQNRGVIPHYRFLTHLFSPDLISEGFVAIVLFLAHVLLGWMKDAQDPTLLRHIKVWMLLGVLQQRKIFEHAIRVRPLSQEVTTSQTDR